MRDAGRAVCVVLLVTTMGGCSPKAGSPSRAATTQGVSSGPLTVYEIQTRPVIGILGVPLGTLVEIEATIVAGRDRNEKGLDGLYLLRVTKISGKSVSPGIDFEFYVPSYRSAGLALASDQWKLYEMRRGEKAQRLDSKDVAVLEAGYVGKQVRLRVYETGKYRGVPIGVGVDDYEFHFYTSLVVDEELR